MERGGRWDTYKGDNNVWYANKIDQGRWQLNTQLKFTWYELTQFSYYGLKELKATKYIPGATRVFMDKFEGCGTCHEDRRVDYATKVFNRFA